VALKIFEDIEIQMNYKADGLDDSWFDENGEVIEGSGMNREFFDFDSFLKQELLDLCDAERELIDSLVNKKKSILEIIEEEEEFLENCEMVYFLDLGVRSAVMALRYLGAYPVSSCNAGSFTEDPNHLEKHHPVIAFHSPHELLIEVEKAALITGCGLVGPRIGCLVLYTDDIRKFTDFAKHLCHSGISRMD